MKRLLPLVLLFLLVSQKPALAYRHQILNEVLGVSTQAAAPVIDPTAEGPGLILPDSPFFFLDQWKQAVRVLLALTPQEKARVYSQIAGQRLAQLRFMLAKNNTQAAMVALQGVSDNFKLAASQVSKAQFSGQDVSVLAKQINDNIKAKQKALDVLENGSIGSLHLEALQTQESLFESKVEVEDSLPSDQIQNEVKNDLARRIARRVSEASDSAKLLKSDLAGLEKEASDEAKASFKNREDALRGSTDKIAVAKLLEAEKSRQQKLLEAQQEATKKAWEALQNAQNAAIGFQKAQQTLEEIKTIPSPVATSPPSSH